MSFKLIRDTQFRVANKDIIDEAQTVASVLGTQLDESLVRSVRAVAKKIVKENEYALQPEQIVDQVVNHLAPQAGMNPQYLTQSQFAKLATEFRMELEDHYDEVYANSEWKQLVMAAYQQYATHSRSQENEEHGWPSDEGIEDDPRMAQQDQLEDPEFRRELNRPWEDEVSDDFDDDFDEDDYTEYSMRQGEMGNPMRRGRYQENEEFARAFDRTEARAINAASRGLTGNDPVRDTSSPAAIRRQKDLEAVMMSKQPARKLSQEEQGWYDAQVDGATPKFPNDSEYMSGWERSQSLSKPWKKAAENEESTGERMKGDGSMLKSLLNQRKEVSSKASEAAKKYEAEGAKAFHEMRMRNEKSPYNPTSQAEEHAAWTKGWSKAATQHYNPEPVYDKKKKAKSKKK